MRQVVLTVQCSRVRWRCSEPGGRCTGVCMGGDLMALCKAVLARCFTPRLNTDIFCWEYENMSRTTCDAQGEGPRWAADTYFIPQKQEMSTLLQQLCRQAGLLDD